MSLESVFKLSVLVNMIDNLTGPIARVNSSVENSVGKIQKLNQGFESMAKTGTVMAGAGYGIANAALAPVEATFETKKALGELASLGIKDLKGLESAATDFSNTWAGTTKAQFITAAYDIKSGISSLSDEGVAKFTELAGITAKGTKSSIAEMTSLFATGYNIYKSYYNDMSDIDFGEMFSAGIAKSVQTFKTTGSGMAEAIQTMGAAATSAKVPMEEQLSILGMLQATMSGSEAGTKYRAFLQAAANAGEQLGLKFTDANNQLLSMPQILALLKGKFGETMNAADKMKLTQAFGTEEAVSLIDLLYTKTGNLQDNILSMYDAMGGGTALVNEMANAINAPEGEKFVRLQQQIHNVMEEIGNQLLPTFNGMLEKGSQILGKVSEWIGKNQELVKVLTIVILTIGIFLMVAGTMIAVTGAVGLIFTKTAGFVRGFVLAIRGIPDMLYTMQIRALYAGDALKAGFSNIKNLASSAVTGIKNVTMSIVNMARTAAINGATALKNMVVGLVGMARQAIMTAVTAMPGLIASVWAFTAALLANPITWIIIGIVALIAAIILLWQNWDTVVKWIQGVWNGFVNGIKAGFDWIMNLFSGMPTWLQVAIAAFMPFIGIPLLIINNWGSITSFFSGLWAGITDAFRSGIDGVKNFITGTLAWFRESGSKILTTFTEGIQSAVSAPIEAVKGGLQKIRNLLPFSDAKEGPLSELTLSGRRVFETVTTGMRQTQDLPADTTEQAFNQMDFTSRDGVKKINLKETMKESNSSTSETTEKDSGNYIDKFYMSVDVSKLKDLPTLFKLLKEIEDFTNSNGPSPLPVGGV